MSFILDALKKSEAERLRRDTPGFAAVPDSGREKPARHWYWIVAVLVVVNVSVLAFIYMKPEHVNEVAAAEPFAEPAATVAASAKQASIAPPVQQPALMEQAAPVAAAVAPPRFEAAPATTREQTQAVAESYPTYGDLNAQGALQLGDMHLDIHVYSDKPQDRFVFVNMRKYKEKATLDEGPVVREITPDGVILDYRGTRFLLPRE